MAGDLRPVHARLEDRAPANESLDVGGRSPHADPETGQRRRAERRRLLIGRDLHCRPDQVGLELHEEAVGSHSAVDPQDVHREREDVEDVRDLVRDRLERRPVSAGTK